MFGIGELVWKVILPIDNKSRTLGKWSPHWKGPFKIEKVFSKNAYALVNVNSGLKIVSIDGKYFNISQQYMKLNFNNKRVLTIVQKRDHNKIHKDITFVHECKMRDYKEAKIKSF